MPNTMISLRRLTQFIIVAEELHFGRAAARLHMAQPALSNAVKRLEETVGVELLTRTKRSVKLTTAGSVFLAEAPGLIAQGDRAVDQARQASQGLIGRIVVGFVGSLSYELVPRILRDLHARLPGVDVDLRELLSKEQVNDLLARRIDVGILRLPISNAGDLKLRVIERERLIAVLPAGHRLAQAEALRLSDIADEQFMVFPPDKIPSLHAKFLLACHDAGFNPRIFLEATQISSMVSLIAAGVGIALLPRQVRSIAHPGVVYKEIADRSKHLSLEIALAWRGENVSPGLRSFLSVAAQGRLKQAPPGAPTKGVDGRQDPLLD
jgi:DNA-binding transcriptional LysR family regulator